MLYKDRPRIKLALTPIDKFAEVIGWILLFTMWALVLFNYTTLPETIPIHFNANGQADGWGNKSMIWILLLIGSVLYVGMTFLNRYPHIFNYPTTITHENTMRQYTTATKMVRYIKLLIVIMSNYLIIHTIQLCDANMSWFMPIL